MKYQAWIVILFCFSGASVFGQINHWESLVLESDIWSYRLGTSEPSSNWNTTNFASSSWSVGAGGIGYGDGDDITTISNTPSLYMRIEFNANQVQLMNALIFHADYDDGFIAYLNGIEIARANVDTLTPSFNYSPPYEREAKVYQGGKSSMWVLDEDLWKGNLLNGTNVLAVHTMNHQGTNSSDMSARYWLHCGVTVSTLVNSLPASWFNFNAFESPVAVCRINSYEELIEDDPSIRAEMEIVWNDSSSSFASYGKAENLKTYIEIEKRGRWSQFVYPKNGYAIEAKDSSWEDTDIEPIGMPKEEDWVLHGPYGDRTFMRNKLAMHMARKQGNYASRTEFVELIINGEYEGIYVLMEKIKRGPDRVDIAKLKQDEITGDDLTGGYIFKTDWQPVDWYSTFDMLTSSNKIPYTYTYPKRKNIVVQQEQYIQKFVDDFEHALQNTNTPYNGKYWYEYIDISSFVDFFLMMEISKDVDAYRASTYYHKDKDSKGGKVHAGPIWDFNFAFGTVDYCNGYIPTGWMYSGNPCSGTNPAWWEKLVNTPAFANAVNCRWNELMTTVWHPDSLAEFISSKAALIAPTVGRNHNRWPTSNPAAVKYIGLNYEDDVDIMKDFLMQRILWLNANMIGNSCMDSNISKPYDVSFAVDMNPYAGIYDTVFVSGDFNSWSGNSHPLSDNDGDGIWTGTYAINQDSIEFKYILDNWQVNESLNVNLPCTKTSGNNTNRFAVLNSNLFVSSCWESCLTCFQSGLGYDTVKFEVNTANIIVGPNGIYAGGGILGGARAVKLHDPDGNGIYTGDTIIDGSVGGKFIFLNSPSSDSDWGAKENLVGLPCADPANWNDRTFPIFSKDTTLQFCYETCSTNSLCSPNLPNHYNVTFKVNTLGVNIGPNGLYAGGGVLGWANAVTLTDTDNDGVWEGSAIVNGVNSGNFAFFNSPNFTTDWGTKEVLTGLPCADPSHYDDRIMPNFTQDTTLLFCFGSCETDGSCPAPAVPKNVSLAVDMNQYSGSTANGVFLNGDFNGWCGSCNAMDDSDGDGVWTVTLPLTADSIEYKFTVDGWNDQEMFAPGLSCTKSGGIYTNRFVDISGDTTLATVCWNSCSSCITVPPPPPANTCIKCDSLNVGDFFLVDGDSIEVVDRTRLLAIVAAQGDLTKVCVSHVADMKNILRGATWFNQDISRWDVSNVTNMNSMFFKNRKFNQDISAWDVSSVTNMLGMFSRCDSFNQNLNTWDVSSVTNLNRMFKEAVSFNGAIAQWNVENVTRMTEMFSSATAFNQDLSDWCVRAFQYQPPVNFALNSALVADHYPRWGNCPQDFDNVTSLATGAFINSSGCVDCSALNIGDYFELGGDTLLVVDRAMLDSLVLLHDDLSKVCVSNITDMKDALRGLRWFNTDIAYWDVSNVTDMSNLFFKAQIFNQDIGNWDVSNVTKMVSMFQVAKVFDQDIGSWDVSGVQRFRAMFRNALAFNQDIGGWDVSSVLNDVQMSSMFRGCASFNQDLSMWCVTNAVTKPSGFDANSALIAANLPLWGTCPTPGSMIGNDHPIASDEANGDDAANPVEMQEIALFPNPTTGIVQIDPVPEGSYKILDAMGKTLEQGTVKEYYNFSEQPNGVYTLMLQTSNTTQYIKVVKQ